MTYPGSQNYIDMVVDIQEIETTRVVRGYYVDAFVIVVLMFLSPQVHIPYCSWTSSLSKHT
jgi:hypothetical protein